LDRTGTMGICDQVIRSGFRRPADKIGLYTGFGKAVDCIGSVLLACID
jgi:hypothetical protein